MADVPVHWGDGFNLVFQRDAYEFAEGERNRDRQLADGIFWNLVAARQEREQSEAKRLDEQQIRKNRQEWVKHENDIRREKEKEKERERFLGGRGTKEYSESDFSRDKSKKN
jgi:hypothetical protein